MNWSISLANDMAWRSLPKQAIADGIAELPAETPTENFLESEGLWNLGLYKRFWGPRFIRLMVQKSGVHQLRLVVHPIIYGFFYILVSWISSINSRSSFHIDLELLYPKLCGQMLIIPRKGVSQGLSIVGLSLCIFLHIHWRSNILRGYG